MNLFHSNPLQDGLSFASPEWFWALLLLLPLLVVFIQAGKRRSALLAKILAPRLQPQLAGRVSPLLRNLRSAFLFLALIFIVTALARPQFGSIEQQIKSRGRDVIIAIDTSRSMLSTDTAPTRLGRAKLIAQDLLNLLHGDRVGLIAFAGDAFLEAPLTLDKGAVLTSIQDLDTNTIPKGGTDIASAIRMAIAAFGKGEGTSRALVLMTDGEELDESGVAAAKEAGALGIKIFTIGFGSATGSLIPIKNDAGDNDFVRDENGQPVNSKLDAPRLTEIANASGGFYLPYGQDAAQVIFDKGLIPLEEKDNLTLVARKPIERYAWPATAALVLLGLWSILGEGRRRVARAVTALIGLGIFMLPSSLQASGLNDYSAGNYQGALQDFEQRLKAGDKTPEVQFDAGAAAYKAGDYAKAAGYFSEAMTSDNPKIRQAATYNLANSLVRTGEAAKEDNAKLSDWKNSLQHYETVLKSNPGNRQAKENEDIVRKLIDELKKQQEQKKQQDQKKDQNKDQKNQKDQSNDQQKNNPSQGGGQDQKDQKDKNNQSKDQQNQDQSKGAGKDQKQSQNQDSKDAQGSQGSNQNQKDQHPSPSQTPSPTPTPKQGDQGNQGEPTPTPSPSLGQGNGNGSQQPQNQKDQQQPNQGQGDQHPTPQQQPQQSQGGQGAQPTPTPAPSPTENPQGASASPSPDQEEQPKGEKADAAEAEQSKDGKMSPAQARALLRSVQDEEAHQLINQQNHAVEQPVHDW